MIISDLEHLEINFQNTRSDTPRKVRGGFVIVSSSSQGNATGGTLAITSTRTFTGSFTYPIFAFVF